MPFNIPSDGDSANSKDCQSQLKYACNKTEKKMFSHFLHMNLRINKGKIHNTSPCREKSCISQWNCFLLSSNSWWRVCQSTNYVYRQSCSKNMKQGHVIASQETGPFYCKGEYISIYQRQLWLWKKTAEVQTESRKNNRYFEKDKFLCCEEKKRKRKKMNKNGIKSRISQVLYTKFWSKWFW